MATLGTRQEPRAAGSAKPSFELMPSSPPISGEGSEGIEVAGFRVTDEVLGKGRYSKVVKARHIRTGEEVACKIILKKDVSEATMKTLTREVTTLQKLRHRNIIQLYEALETPSHLYIFLQYARGGELYDYLVAHGRLTEKEARAKFRNILSAVYYCHGKGICHRDLKVENILLDADMNVLISDFGLSNVFKEGALLDTFCGSFSYAAPEVLVRRPYSGPEVDVWALGVLLFVMIAGSLPFKTETDIMAGRFSHLPDISPSCLRVFKMIFKPEPRMRPSVADIMRTPWVNETYGPDSLFLEVTGAQPAAAPARDTLSPEPDQQAPALAADAPSGGGGSGHGTPRTPSSPASFRENTPVASRSSSPVPVAGAFPETVDNDILFLMCNKYGYDANRVRTSVNENLFDSTMATYLILLDRKAMYPKLHTADMRAANNLAESAGPGRGGPRKAASSPHIPAMDTSVRQRLALDEERPAKPHGPSRLREQQSSASAPDRDSDSLRAHRRGTDHSQSGQNADTPADGVRRVSTESSRSKAQNPVHASEPQLNERPARGAADTSRSTSDAKRAATRAQSDWQVSKVEEKAPSEVSMASSGRRKSDSEGVKPRTVRFPFSVKSTSSIPPQALAAELGRVLDKLAISHESPEPFVFFCRKNSCEWEVEICKVPLLSVHGLKFRRLGGDAEEYRALCSRILDNLKKD